LVLCYVLQCNVVVIIYFINIFANGSDHKVISFPHQIVSIFVQVMRFLLIAKEDMVNIYDDRSLTMERKISFFCFVGWWHWGGDHN
jgi:hypothetical protein